MRRIKQFEAIELHDSQLYGWEVSTGRNADSVVVIGSPVVTLKLGLLTLQQGISYRSAELRFTGVRKAVASISLVDLRRCPDIFEATCTLETESVMPVMVDAKTPLADNAEQPVLRWDIVFSGVEGTITILGSDFTLVDASEIDTGSWPHGN